MDDHEFGEESTSSAPMAAAWDCLSPRDGTEFTDDGSGADGVSNRGVGVSGDTLKASSLESKPDIHGQGIGDHLENASPVGCVGTSCWSHCVVLLSNLRPRQTLQALWSQPTVS